MAIANQINIASEGDDSHFNSLFLEFKPLNFIHDSLLNRLQP